MDRIKELGRYQKILLLLMAVMILAFTVIYPIVTALSGFLYEDTILVPAEEDGGTVYSGKIRGTAATFTVSADKTVIFQYGNTVYGPYTVKEDPTAIPKDSDLQTQMTGIELRCDGEIVFRGGRFPCRREYDAEGKLTRATFRCPEGMQYLRVTVMDAQGHRAWTNPIFDFA